MTAASAAAVGADRLGAGPGGLGLVVLGGLVEGAALGTLQGRVLAERWGARVARGWWWVTVLVAGVGWAAASAPSALSASSSSDAGAAPPLGLVLLGAVGLGLAMGALLGLAQAAVLHRSTAIRRPWRWVRTSAAAWAIAMPVVFLGATTPDAGWPVAAILALGPPTGVLAGGVLGLMTMSAVGGPSPRDAAVLAVLARRRTPVGGAGTVGLRVTGRRSGWDYELPVQAVGAGDTLVVLPGRAARKTWWRNLAPGAGTAVAVLTGGRWHAATAVLVRAADPRWTGAVAAYRGAHPRVTVAPEQPVVILRGVPRGAPAVPAAPAAQPASATPVSDGH